MTGSRWSVILFLAVVLISGFPAMAQREPHIGYIYPAGGQQGTTLEVKIGGQYLDGVSEAYISDTGIEAAVITHTKPLTQKQANELRTKLRELQKDRNNPGVATEIAELRKKLATFNRNANPAIAETVTLNITIAPDAKPGKHQLRLMTTPGLSNPMTFCVDQLPEFREGQNEAEQTRVTLPAIVNGQILPGEVDRFRFQAQRGQSLVISARARALIPYLADAVPGWFQATLGLYDANGVEVAYDDDYRFNPDPVLHFEVPRDGEYVLEIKDAIYRGREDFVYRVIVGELPFVTSIFPLGGAADVQTRVKVKGWNLPTDTLSLDGVQPGIHAIAAFDGTCASDPLLFATDTLPECVAQEKKDESERAQKVTLPVVVNGRIDRPDDRDVFRFEGRGGDKIVAEILARRLNSPVDSMIELTDAAGKRLAFNDDHEDKAEGLATHHADSFLSATLPTDGTYLVHIRDAQNKGGPAYAYRLRLSSPRPDFELRIVPSSINARAGTTTLVTVYALRKDGFSGDIALTLKDAPPEWNLSGNWIPAGQNLVRATLSVTALNSSEPVKLAIEGRATIDEREVVRPAVPADDMMQAFIYRHLVCANDLVVAVKGGGRRPVAQLLDQGPMKVAAGGMGRVRVAASRGSLAGEVELELSEPPEGIVIESVSRIREGLEILFKSDATKTTPGLKGNLICSAFVQRMVTPRGEGAKPVQRRVALGTLPAIPFEVVEP